MHRLLEIGDVTGAEFERGAGELGPREAGGMAGEIAGLEVRDFAGADPFALIVGVKEFAVRGKGDAVGGPQSVGERFHAAGLGVDLDAPAAPRGLGLVAAAEADVQGNEEVAGLVHGWPEGELVVVAGDAPFVANRGEFVRGAVAIEVGELRDFGPLRDVNGVVIDNVQAEGFVEPRGEAGELDVLGVGGAGVVNEPDFAATRASEQLAIRSEAEAADFEDAIRGRFERRSGADHGRIRPCAEESRFLCLRRDD